MPAEMLLQVTDLAKCRVTDGTFVRSGYADALVHLFLFRLHLRHANFVISVADDERLLQHYLRYQTFRLGRYLRLLSRVTLDMILENGARTERHVAYVTFMWFRV